MTTNESGKSSPHGPTGDPTDEPTPGAFPLGLHRNPGQFGDRVIGEPLSTEGNEPFLGIDFERAEIPWFEETWGVIDSKWRVTGSSREHVQGVRRHRSSNNARLWILVQINRIVSKNKGNHDRLAELAPLWLPWLESYKQLLVVQHEALTQLYCRDRDHCSYRPPTRMELAVEALLAVNQLVIIANLLPILQEAVDKCNPNWRLSGFPGDHPEMWWVRHPSDAAMQALRPLLRGRKTEDWQPGHESGILMDTGVGGRTIYQEMRDHLRRGPKPKATGNPKKKGVPFYAAVLPKGGQTGPVFVSRRRGRSGGKRSKPH